MSNIMHTARNYWPYLFITPLFLIGSLVHIFNMNGMMLLAPAALFSYLVLALVGILVGLLMVFGGTAVRMLIAAFVVVLFIFSSIVEIPHQLMSIRIRYILLLPTFILAVPFYYLRRHLDKILVTIFGVNLILTAVSPSTPTMVTEKFSAPVKEEGLLLPPYIHIILDGHIAIEGIPPNEYNGKELAHELKNKYIQQGFRVYGRAFSRYSETQASFPSFFNLYGHRDDGNKYAQVIKHETILKQNDLFAALSKRGYRINVLQSGYIELCNDPLKYNISECYTYRPTADVSVISSHAIYKQSLFWLGKLLLHFKLDRIADRVAKRFPEFNKLNDLNPDSLVMSVASFEAFNKTAHLWTALKPGNAYIIHLLLPHQPHVYDSQCVFAETPDARIRSPLSGDISSLPYYYEQVKCTASLVDKIIQSIDDNPALKDSTIVIHGDHGSRLGMVPNVANVAEGQATPEDFIQTFSTLFVVRSPNHEPGYDRRPLPLDFLLKGVVMGKEPPLQESNLRTVYLDHPARDNDSSFKQVPMPPFSEGLPAREW